MTAPGHTAAPARTLVTPEDLPLTVHLAPVGSRLAAYLIDLVLMALLTAVVAWLVLAAGAGIGFQDFAPFVALFLLAHFVIWNGYFLFFELRWQGRTPGKRALGLRVVARHGGPLTGEAVLARNLLRELELSLPLQALVAPELVYGPAPGWASAIASAWIALFLVLPLLNRDRARVGDLVAGTLVIVKPEGKLAEDQGALPDAVPGGAGPAFAFTPQQLAHYGVRELQVLERLLRDFYGGGQQLDVLREVADRIVFRIGFGRSVADDDIEPFLRAFYGALRHRLEGELLLGRRHERRR